METCSTNTRYTLKQVVDFCWQHRGKHGFHNYTYEEASRAILYAADDNGLLIVCDDHGICGVVSFEENHKGRSIFINHIFGIRDGFRTMIHECFKRYPGYSVAGFRGPKIVTYQPRNLKYG